MTVPSPELRLSAGRNARMREVFPRVFVGDELCCRAGSVDCAVVHACKDPCHRRTVGYAGNLPRNHPEYLMREEDDDLWLNMIDPPLPLFQAQTFLRFLAFASTRYDRGSAVLIHCNQGESRSASLALLFMARHLRALPPDSFDVARSAYGALDADYRSSAGIERFLSEQWGTLCCPCARCQAR